MSIPFTHYLLPDGRTEEIVIDMPEDVEDKARALINKGYHFDIEILTTGLISMTCEKDEELLSICLSHNGPEIVYNVKKLIENACSKQGIS